MLFRIQCDAGNLSRCQSTLDEQLGVARVVDDVDVLVAHLTDNAMNAATLDTYASAYWIDAVVIALNSYLSTLTRHTGNATNGNQTILNLRNLSLEQSLQELIAGT